MKPLIFSLLIVLLLLPRLGLAQGLVEELNAFRQRPLEFASLTGKRLEELKKIWPESLWRGILNGVKEVQEDEVLTEVAAQRAEKILSVGLPLPENFSKELSQILEERAFPALMAHESYAVLAFENPLSEEEAQGILLTALIAGALQKRDGDALLLFPCWNRVGAAFRFGEIAIEGENYHAAVIVFILAAIEDETPFLLGQIYGVMEEKVMPLEEATIKLENLWNKKVLLTTNTWPDGSYCLEGYPAGNYLLEGFAEGWKPKKELNYLPNKPHRKDFYLFR